MREYFTPHDMWIYTFDGRYYISGRLSTTDLTVETARRRGFQKLHTYPLIVWDRERNIYEVVEKGCGTFVPSDAALDLTGWDAWSLKKLGRAERVEALAPFMGDADWRDAMDIVDRLAARAERVAFPCVADADAVPHSAAWMDAEERHEIAGLRYEFSCHPPRRVYVKMEDIQIYLLKTLARLRGVSYTHLVTEAIQQYIDDTWAENVIEYCTGETRVTRLTCGDIVEYYVRHVDAMQRAEDLTNEMDENDPREVHMERVWIVERDAEDEGLDLHRPPSI